MESVYIQASRIARSKDRTARRRQESGECRPVGADGDAGLLGADHVLERLQLMKEAAASTFTEPPEDSKQATTTRYLQKAALVADQAWQQTVSGSRGLPHQRGSTPPGLAPKRQN